MIDRGLDAEGFIRREGSLDRVAPEFDALVGELRTRVVRAYGGRLNGLYLYGSVPRGAARIGHSDLDALVVLNEEPSEADRPDADGIEKQLDAAHPQVDGVGVGLLSRDQTLSPNERYNLGFFVACLCTPMLGEDLGTLLPRYRATGRLARDTNGDIADALQTARDRCAAGLSAPEQTRMCRVLARKVLRSAFTLVMPWWGGWTSDMDLSAQVISSYYPAWRKSLQKMITLARQPQGDAALRQVFEFGETTAREYASRIGLKSPPAQN